MNFTNKLISATFALSITAAELNIEEDLNKVISVDVDTNQMPAICILSQQLPEELQYDHRF